MKNDITHHINTRNTTLIIVFHAAIENAMYNIDFLRAMLYLGK